MREDTGRPDISFKPVFVDASSREYFISLPKAKQIIEAGAVEIERLLRELMAIQKQMEELLKAILVVEASGQNLSGDKEDY